MLKSKYNINTGTLLMTFLQKKRIFKSGLGTAINRNGRSVNEYLKNESIQTGILIEICYALKHNFFRDIANELPEDFTITNPADQSLISEKDQLIVQLQEENKVLKIQNDILMQMKK